MGLLNDYFKAKIYGNEVRKAIREVKGDRDIVSGTEIRRIDRRNKEVCGYCGANVGNKKIKGECQKWSCKKWLCSKCAKICKKCKKIFCPKHIKNHGCK